MEHTNQPVSMVNDNMPFWARSTNPIVRRHLGMYWRTLPPQIQPILLAIGVWGLLLFLAIGIPLIYQLTMPMIVVSILAIPVGVMLYAHILFSIASAASAAMSQELRNNTFELLRVTPMSLPQIFLGKVAASIWRRMDDLMMVAQIVAFFGAPLVVMNIQQALPLEEYPFASQTLIVLMLFVTLLRMVVEPLMVGGLAVMVGSAVAYRSPATTISLALTGFYFLFINLLRFFPVVGENILAFILVNFVLPVAAPLVILWLTLQATTMIVTRD